MNALHLPKSSRALAGALVVAALALPSIRAHAADDAATHDELRKLKTTYETAIASNNLEPLQALFGPASSGVTVDNQGFKNYGELKSIYDGFHASFPGATYSVKLSPEPSLLFGDIAVAYGTAEESVKVDGREFTYPSSFTAVLHREGADWKLVRSQMTMDPFKNSVVQYFISRTKLIFGGGALIAGLLAGFIAGRMTGRT